MNDQDYRKSRQVEEQRYRDREPIESDDTRRRRRQLGIPQGTPWYVQATYGVFTVTLLIALALVFLAAGAIR